MKQGPTTYQDDFRFNVLKQSYVIPTRTIITVNSTTSDYSVYNQDLSNVRIKGVTLPSINTGSSFKSSVIAFSEGSEGEGDGQYEWLVEFTCGTENALMIPILFPNDFVGINLFSKSKPHSPRAKKNMKEMLDAIANLGLSWAIEAEPWKGMDTGFNVVPHNDTCTYEFEF